MEKILASALVVLMTLQSAAIAGSGRGPIHTAEMNRIWNSAKQFTYEGDYKQSIEALTKLLSLFPPGDTNDDLQYQAHYERGKAYSASDQFDQALVDYQWCLKRKPKEEPVIYRRAETCAACGRLREAVDGFAMAVALRPENTDNHICLAKVLIKLKRYPEAIAQYDAVLKRVPEDEEIWRKRADAELLSANYKQAVIDYSKAIKFEPDQGWYYFYRASAYEKLNQKSAADADRKRAKELNFHERASDLTGS